MASTSAGDKAVTGFLKRIIGTPIGQMIPLTDLAVTIGRAKKSNICIYDPNISRSHCTLNYDTDGWHITDLGGVNGTYLDNHRLQPHTQQPLKDGLGIYMGPPAEAPVAFVFIKNKLVPTSKEEQEIHSLNDKTENRLHSTESTQKRETKLVPTPEEEQERLQREIQSLKDKIENTQSTQKQRAKLVPLEEKPECLQREIQSLKDKNENKLQNTQPTQKRRAMVSIHSSQSKKHIPSTSSNQPVNSQSTTDVQDSDDGNDSDISICSLDSLRTRIRKINSKKRKKKHCSNKIDNLNVASTSTSYNPCVPSTSSGGQGSMPSTSSAVAENLTNLKKTKPGVYKELETLFNDSGDSLTETAHEIEDSESLLDDSILSTHPNPTQSLEAELQFGANQSYAASTSSKPQQKSNLENLNEQLKKAHAKLLKENSEQKQKLNQIMEDSTIKKDSGKLGEMLEEELICNICTEVFIKATTLGCSHTFCEHCIWEWKKKQKRCPMCREIITSETRILIMDNFIDKVVEKLDKEYQDKRKEVIANREAAKANAKVKKTKKKKGSRSRAARNAITSTARAMQRESPEMLRRFRMNLLENVNFHVMDEVMDFNRMDPIEDDIGDLLYMW